MADKSDNIEVFNRIRIIQEWLLKGYPTTDIVQNSSLKWGVGERQAQKYIKRAFEIFREQCNQKQSERMAFHSQARMKLYKEAYDKGQYRVCREILTDLGKLEGLYTERLDLTTKGKEVNLPNLSTLSYDELLNLINESGGENNTESST